jgi:hypothetical protein
MVVDRLVMSKFRYFWVIADIAIARFTSSEK